MKKAQGAQLPSFSDRNIVDRDLQSLHPFQGNARKHSPKQIEQLQRSMQAFGFTAPILIDEVGTILCGHGRAEAAKRLGLRMVPTIAVRHLTAHQKTALVIADNKLAEESSWDLELLRAQVVEILSGDVDVELSGFSTGEVDLLIDGNPDAGKTDPADDMLGLFSSSAVSRPGDIWQLGDHKILCGDARDGSAYDILMGKTRAELVIGDPPWNVRIQGHAMGRGRIEHREFLQGSGEMSREDYRTFLMAAAANLVRASVPTSIHYVFSDWKHIGDLLSVAERVDTELKNILVWNKTNAGQGGFYRMKHEFIVVFQNGPGKPINNFERGAKGRYRTSVIDYPGLNGFRAGRQQDLEMHPTVKPVGLIADLIRDCSRRGGLVLDPFAGSGTTILAAERTGRVARALELDPLYVDMTVRRFEHVTGRQAISAATGATFAETTKSVSSAKGNPNV